MKIHSLITDGISSAKNFKYMYYGLFMWILISGLVPVLFMSLVVNF